MNKIDHKQKETDNADRKNSKKNSKWNVRYKSTVIEMKNVFNWLIRKQNTAEEISKLDAMTVETSKIEKKKDWIKPYTTRLNNQEQWGKYKSVHTIKWIYKKEKIQKKKSEGTITENFPKLMSIANCRSRKLRPQSKISKLNTHLSKHTQNYI